MTVAQNHAERVAGLASMAMAECEGDFVAAVAALIDAAVPLALAGKIEPHQLRERIIQNFRTVTAPTP